MTYKDRVMIVTVLDHTVEPAILRILNVFAEESAAQDYMRIQAEAKLKELQEANPEFEYTLKDECTLYLGLIGYTVVHHKAPIVEYMMDKYTVIKQEEEK